VFTQALQQIQAHADAAGDNDWLAQIDSTIVRAHQHAAATGRKGGPMSLVKGNGGVSGWWVGQHVGAADVLREPGLCQADVRRADRGPDGALQRRTPTLQAVIEAVPRALAGTAGACLLLHLHQVLSWATLLACLCASPCLNGRRPGS